LALSMIGIFVVARFFLQPDVYSCPHYFTSRRTVAGEKAGKHTAMYFAPPGSGVLYRTHSPRLTMMAFPASASSTGSPGSPCNLPRKTIVYSSNSGVCPGSLQPDGLVICAMLTAAVPEFTRPINSSMIFGGSPAAGITVGAEMIRAISKNYMETRLRAIESVRRGKKTPPAGRSCDRLF